MPLPIVAKDHLTDALFATSFSLATRHTDEAAMMFCINCGILVQVKHFVPNGCFIYLYRIIDLHKLQIQMPHPQRSIINRRPGELGLRVHRISQLELRSMKRNLLSSVFRLFIRAFSIKSLWPMVTDELFLGKSRKEKQNVHHTPFPANNQTFQQDLEDRQMVMDAALRSVAL